MLDLYAKATITPEDAATVERAAEIVIYANAKAKNWDQKQIELRKILYKHVIKVHTVDNQPHCGGESSCRKYPDMVLEKGRPCRAFQCENDARSNNRGYTTTLVDSHPCRHCKQSPENCSGSKDGQCTQFLRHLEIIGGTRS